MSVNSSNVNTNHISVLPNDLLLSIFQHLSPDTLARISRICKKWNEIAKADFLWKPFVQGKFSNHQLGLSSYQLGLGESWKQSYIALKKAHGYLWVSDRCFIQIPS